jgi:Uma2 family endonuclease
VTACLSEELTLEIRRLKLPYLTSRNTLIKPDRAFEGELPDLIVLDKSTLQEDPYWQESSTISLGKSAKLVIEVVSTNWQDDYAHKLVDYERLGIAEYWIVDYLGLGGTRYIGSPKQPTLTVYHLLDGEYQGEQFRRGERVRSQVFPELNLTTDQIFDDAR